MIRKLKMIITLGFVAVILLAVVVYYFGAFYPKFNSFDKKTEFEIPALEENFVPQGLDYVAKDDIILLSGYMSDGAPSRIYLINRTSGEVVKYVTLTKNNVDYVGHAGGVASDGTMVWVVGDKLLETALYSDVVSCQNGGKVEIKESITTGNGCDFVDVDNGKLIVGEFYHEKKYQTPEQHHIKVSENETTHAIAYFYNIDHSNISGINEHPIHALTLPDFAQGVVVNGNKIIVSTSWSIKSSNIIVYSNPLGKNTEKTISINDKNVPLYELNSNNCEDTIKAPAMSEEITIIDGRTYILFESACNKYKMVNRTRTKNVISIKL